MQGSELKAIRVALGMTQAMLAEELGLTTTFIGLMERDAKPIERRTELAMRYLDSQAAGEAIGGVNPPATQGESDPEVIVVELGDKAEAIAAYRGIKKSREDFPNRSKADHVIVTLLQREHSRARRKVDKITWRQDDGGKLTTDQDGVHLTIWPESRGRWSIHAAKIDSGYSPPVPHWRKSLEDAKIRAVLAIDETLDHVEAVASERLVNAQLIT